MRLTNKTIDILKPTQEPYEIRDGDVKGFLARVQPTGLITFYFDYRDYAGKRQRIRLGKYGTISPAGARDAAIKYAAEVALGKNVQADKKQAKAENVRAKHNTLGAFLTERYQPWVEAERKSGKATVKRIRQHFKHLLHLQLSAIDYWSIEKWRAERRKCKIKPATINRDTGTLKALLSKAVEWGVIEHHPLQRLKPIRFDDRAKVRFLSKQEEMNLRDTLFKRDNALREARVSANEWRKARNYPLFKEIAPNDFSDHLTPMVLLSINTGLRRGELFKLSWRNISLSRALLTVEGIDAKSGKTRHIPLNSEAHAILTRWRKQTCKEAVLVFPNNTGCQFDNVNTAWRKLLKDANIREFRWHDMRHHFASKLVMANVDLNTVRELLGHSDITMTLRYAHLAPEHKANAVEKLVEVA